MRAEIKLIDGVAFEGTSGSGHRVIMDGPPEFGGRNRGVRPMETLLIGMGGCSAFDVVHILRKGRHEISDCRVELEATRATTEPKVFTHIHAHYVVSGRDLKPAVVKRAIDLSVDKYCSATIMLAKTARISHDFEIVDDQTE